MSRLPTLFIPHGGGPCFFMDCDPPDTWERMAEYLRRVPDDVGTRPKALVVISGHWEKKVVTIQNNPAPPLLHDYYGFPQSTYQISFPAPGAPDVSARVAELLEVAGITWKYDHLRGFDHGVFIPLKVAFPRADVPIVQRFDDWLEEVLTKEPPEARVAALAAWAKAPAARDAHPREEHLLPLHVVVGAAGNDPGRRTLKDVVMGAVESAFRFG